MPETLLQGLVVLAFVIALPVLIWFCVLVTALQQEQERLSQWLGTLESRVRLLEGALRAASLDRWQRSALTPSGGPSDNPPAHAVSCPPPT